MIFHRDFVFQVLSYHASAQPAEVDKIMVSQQLQNTDPAAMLCELIQMQPLNKCLDSVEVQSGFGERHKN